jgi:F-type H+-transporting ATPase subunit alpha
METNLFNAGIRPAMNAGSSVSRVGGAAQTKLVKKLGGQLRLALAQFRELEAFAQFASDLDEATRKQLEHGQRATEILKQSPYSPMSVAQMGLSLFVGDKGLIDELEMNRVSDFERALQSFASDKYKADLEVINAKPVFDDEVEATYKKIVEDFKKMGTW